MHKIWLRPHEHAGISAGTEVELMINHITNPIVNDINVEIITTSNSYAV